MTANDRIILLDTDSSTKNEIDKILEEEFSFSNSDLITNKSDLEQQNFNSIKVFLINQELSWLNVPVFLKQLSVDYPYITKIVFSIGTATKKPATIEQRYFDGSLGNFQDNSHLFGSVLSFALQRTEERKQYSELYKEYKLLFDSTPIGFFRSTEEGKLLLLNSAMINLFGYDSEEEMSHVQVKDLYFDPDHRNTALESFRDKGYFSSIQEKMKKKNGEVFWVSMQARAIFDSSGKLDYYEGSLIDITREKELELQIRDSEKQYRNLFETTGTGICLINEDSSIEICNFRFEEITRYSRTEIEKKMKWIDFIPVNELEKLSQMSNQIRTENISFTHQIETQLITKDGEILDIIAFINYIPEKKQSINSFIDITERKQIERELKESERRYKEAKLIAQAAEFIYDIKTEIIRSSEDTISLFGFENDIKKSGNIFEIIHPDDKEKLRKTFKQSIDDNLPIATSFRVVLDNKEEKSLYLRGDVIFDDNDPVEIIGLIQDITPLTKTEQELRKSETKFKNIFGSAPFGLFMYELNEKNQLIFRATNKSSDEILGVDTTKFLGKTIEEAFPGLAETEILERYKIAAKEGISWSSNRIDYEDGAISGAYEVNAFQTSPNVMSVAFQDVTERIRMQEELRDAFDQIEKNLEQFAVLVDSIRNPLAVIVGLVDQYGKEEKEIVIKHANLIDDIISHIDERTLESEEVRRFLKKNFD